MPTYTDFTLTLYQTQNGYELTAHGPGEIAVPPQPIPPELSEQLATAASQFQHGEALPVEQMQTFGKLLYRVLFPPSIAAAYAAAQQVVAPEGHLRLRLAIYPPELNALPWELLYHPQQARFLAALLTQPVVRYIESSTPVAALETTKPLRLLYVQSMPADLPPLDLEASQRALAQAWGQSAEITVLRQPTRQALQNALRQPFHALHYDGHAFFDEAAGSSALMLTDEQGNATALSGADLAYDLNGTSVRLVMLAACQSGMDARRARFSGIAHELMKASSLPAVIAMQASISDSAAIAFTCGFYHALADEYPLDAATTEGRKAILSAAGGEFATSEWATPVLFLRGAGQIFAIPEDAPAPGEPPYKGLQYFDETDTTLFFGRAELSQTLADRLRAERFLAVVGASGSGKSSVVRAGLLPKLRQTGGWTIVSPFTPAMGSEPLLALANALLPLLEPDLSELDCLAEAKKLTTHLRGGDLSLREIAGRILQKQGAARLVLVVDQFEELFTTFREKTTLQSEFVNVLLAAVEADSPVSVVITLRADFYAPCAQFAGLRAALENHQAFIGPMNAGELRQAIEQPARLNDWQLEDGLVEMLLRDVGDEPGNLPLLSHALLETWQRRKGRTLTLQGYQQSGGVQGAIARTADAVINGLNTEQQAVARRIFLGLTELGEGTQDTRRRAALDEIAPQSDMRPAVDAVIKTLADARLVTTSDQSAEVAHEALIREWPTLRRWLDEDRSSLRLHRELNEDAREWANLNRDEGALYRGARLAAAAEWAETHRDEMTPLEGEFLQASQQAVEQEALEREAQRQRELEQAQRLAKTQRQRTIVLTAGLAVALVLVGVALWFMRSANINLGQANTAGTQAAENLLSARQNAATATHALGLSEQRGTQAAEQAATAEAASTQAVAQQSTAEAERGRAEDQSKLALSRQLAAQAINYLAEKPDLAALLSVEAYRAADTFEARNMLLNSIQVSPRLEALLQGDYLFTSVTFSPDGTLLAANGPESKIVFWDTNTWQPKGETLPGQDGIIHQMFFTPDGKKLVVSYCGADFTYDWVCSPGIWNLSTGIATYEALPITNTTLTLSPNGWLLAAAFGQDIQLWDIQNRQLVGEKITLPYGRNAKSLAFSLDERWLLVGEESKYEIEDSARTYGYIEAWDVSNIRQGTITPLPYPLNRRQNAVESLAFSADGSLLASGGCAPMAMYMVSCPNGELQVWQVMSAPESGYIQIEALASPLTIQNGPVALLAFSAAGNGSLAINGADNRISLFDLTDLDIAVNEKHPLGLALDASQSRTFIGANDTINNWALNPAGNLLATTAMGQINVWNIAPEQLISKYIAHDWAFGEGAIRFAPETQKLVLFSGYGELISYDVQTDEQTEPQQINGYWGGLVYIDRQGQILALMADSDQTARLWNVITDSPLSPVLLDMPYIGYDEMITYSGMAVSPDGKTLVVGSWDGVNMWDISSGPSDEIISPQPFSGPYNSQTISLDFNPQGSFLATGKRSGGITIWSMPEQNVIAQLLPGSIEPVTRVAFSADGKLLAAGICLDYREAEEGAFCAEYEIQLWDVNTWQQLGQPFHGLPFVGMNNYVTGLTFRNDGKYLASISRGNELVLWDLSPENWSTIACVSAKRNLTQSEWQQYFPGEAYRKTCPNLPDAPTPTATPNP